MMSHATCTNCGGWGVRTEDAARDNSTLEAVLHDAETRAVEMRDRGRGYGGGYGASMVRDADRDLALVHRVRAALAVDELPTGR